MSAASTSLNAVIVQFGATAANDDSVTPPPAAPAPQPVEFTRETVAALLMNGFAGIDYVTGDGEGRVYAARLGVKKHLTGTSTPEQRAAREARDEKSGNLTVWARSGGYRSLKVARITEIRVAGRRYVAAAALAVAVAA